MLVLLAAAALAATQAGVMDYWSTPNHSIVRFYSCVSGVCGQMVQLSSAVKATTDINNPDPAQRKRPLCGLVIGHGFHLAGSNRAIDGYLYDPESGKTYRGEMDAQGNELRLRGYIGIPLFGRTETWHEAQAVPVCKP